MASMQILPSISSDPPLPTRLGKRSGVAASSGLPGGSCPTGQLSDLPNFA
jgi:hypothetical protein